MTHGAMIAIHAAAAAAKARTQVLDTFRLQDATRPERARPLADVGLSIEDKAVHDLISAGVIRGVDSRGRLTILGDSIDRVDGYYLDEQAYIAHRDGTSKKTSRKEATLIACMLGLAAVGVTVLAVVLARN